MSERKFVISTDTTTDLTRQWFEENQVVFIPHGIVLDGETIQDDFGQTIAPGAVYEKLRRGAKISTVQGSYTILHDTFEKACSSGKDMLHISFSGKLTGTYNVAIMLGQEMMEKYPGRTVLVLDSLSATMGQGLFIMEAAKLADQGLSIREAYEKLEAIRLKVCHFFTVDDLNFLCRGGRLSKTSAVAGTIMGVKPILYLNDDGLLVPLSKVRGRAAAIKELTDLTAGHIENPEGQTIYIAHADCEADAKLLAKSIEDAIPGVKTHTYMLGTTIGSHAGPGTLATLFWGKSRL